MAVLKLDEQKALNLYPNASKEFREMLENTFGEEFFKRDVTERIKTLNDAFKATGRPETPEFKDIPEDLRPFFKATYNVVVLSEALNEGKRFDLYDEKVNRYYPWFRTGGSPSAFGFGGAYYVISVALAGTGSRLCLKDGKLARYLATQFKEEYQKMLAL
jgi:hypothetical protein